MKAPLSWLKEYVDIDCSAEELKNKLFSCGFEVEDMYNPFANIDKIVTCKINKISKHPNANKLSVTEVDAGKYGTLQIITAATNIFEGAIVPVALDGSTLYNGEKINTGDLRGLTSYGMFCSGEELGITDAWYKGASVNGILILNEDYPLGEEMTKILGLNDVMFDINVTANRPDCQSILGLAREVAAVLKKQIKMPDLTFETGDFSTKEKLVVENNCAELCSRYIAHYVKNIKIEESPLWLKRRLFLMGIRPINNIVDITNYVLLEIGQPMHAFDYNEINDKIVVRRADENEKITTLDEKEFSLNPDVLVIADSSKPLALAGVMGGANSGIKDDTKEIVFESAKFKRDNVRKTSRSLGIRTDSSSRFEKGIDISSPEIGMSRALNLISTLKCGEIACDCYDLCFESLENKVIKTSVKKINEVLGIQVPTEKIVEILKSLNFEVEINEDAISVKVPLYRDDMEDYPDLAEEIIREYGYDFIEPTLLKTSSITNGGKTIEQEKIDNLKNLLVGFGFNEIITYSFVSEKEYDLFGIDKTQKEHKFIKILNPLGEDLAVMRTSLLPSIIRIAASNVNRKNFDGKLFEFAKTYNSEVQPLESLPIENSVLSFATFGEKENFFTIKGYVEGLIQYFCNGIKVKYLPCDLKAFHPTRCAYIVCNDEVLGYFGQINPEITAKLDADKPIYAGEIFYDKLNRYFNSKIIAKQISKFPQIERDIALLLDDEVLCGEVIDCILANGGEYLEGVKLFDVYKGDQVAQGKKSMAFNLIFVSQDRTLSVEEIDNTIKNILEQLKQKFNAELR